MTDQPTIELLTDSVEINPLGGMFPSFSIASLHRIYSVEGLRPVRVRVYNHTSKPWSTEVSQLGPDGSWNLLDLNRSVPCQDDNGEALADRLVRLAARLQIEASR